jgi:hypothetical protein
MNENSDLDTKLIFDLGGNVADVTLFQISLCDNQLTSVSSPKKNAEEFNLLYDITTESYTVDFYLLQSAVIDLSIFDLQGKKVTTLTNTNFTAGNHSLNFRKEDIKTANGFYIFRLNTANNQLSKKIMAK